MNFMKKILNQGDDGSQTYRSDQQLALQHLNKLFNEIKIDRTNGDLEGVGSLKGPSKYDIQAYEAFAIYTQKIYRLLPLFLKVFGDSNPLSPTASGSNFNPDLLDKFSDLTTFTGMVARLMVTEIRRKASNKTTQDASETILNFLLVPPSESQPIGRVLSNNNGNNNLQSDDAKGWMLLSTLNLLVHEGGTSLIPIMASNSLPSTLVKCLYLFFDLPLDPQEGESRRRSSSFLDQNLLSRDKCLSSRDRKSLLRRIFCQLVIRICAHQSSLYELTRKDDLALLFNAVTSWCAPHNIEWRQCAADVVLFMAKCNCVNVNYLHEKSCISSSIENMSRLSELSKASEEEITDMLATVIDFLNEVYRTDSSVINILLDDFKNNLGYHFIVDFVLKLERDIQLNGDSIKKIFSLTTSLMKIGSGEIKPRPLSINQLFIIADFLPPKPNPLHSIKNLSAFTVFQTLWFKAKSNLVQELILTGLYRLYRDDGANYFILDSQNTLSQFADKLNQRDITVQEKFFAILKYIIFELKYVPCKELISVSILIKSKPSFQSSLLCLRSLLSIIKFNSVFRDVYREVGILDIVTGLLLEYSQNICDLSSYDDDDAHLFEIMIELTYHSIIGPNNHNCLLFCESHGLKHISSLLPITTFRLSKQSRKVLFQLIQQLILSNSGEESMAQLLSILHTHGSGKNSPEKKVNLTLEQEITFKTNILKSLVQVLRESHRCRTIFRKVGGFIHVMSVLVDMEGSLADSREQNKENQAGNKSQVAQWDQVDRKRIWNLLKFVFLALTTAMRYEPANARFFAYEICPINLTDALRLLGCFTLDKLISCSNIRILSDSSDSTSNYLDIFSTTMNSIPPKSNMSCLESCCLVVRLLYDMALDIIDKEPKTHQIIFSSLLKNDAKPLCVGSKVNERPPSLPLVMTNTSPSVPIIIHSSVVIVMFHILPSIPSENLQIFVAETFLSLLKSERNQQALCEANLLNDILSDKFELALTNEKHHLHLLIRNILEKLAAQSISPRELKYFLRLGNPINCIPIDDISRSREAQDHQTKNGGPIPLSTIKTLVSMITPKDTDIESLLQPPFIEFDMSQEGFGCLFFPSVAPVCASSNICADIIAQISNSDRGLYHSFRNQVNPSSSSNPQIMPSSITGNENENNYQLNQGIGGVIGGIGTGERSFPPQSGLTFLTWVCVDLFPACDEETHNIRLLTISRSTGNGEEYACLQLQISARDRAILISSQEVLFAGDQNSAQNGQDCKTKDPDFNIRVWSPEMLKESRWHHIAVVLNRALLKNSTVALYVDGHLAVNQKFHYINSSPGQGTLLGGTNNQQAHVNAIIGTPPQWRKQSRLVWKQGPCQLIEEPLNANLIKSIYSLGPHYIGSFQGTNLYHGSTQVTPNQRISEERLIFGISSRSMSVMTLAKMKRVYSRFDCRQISKMIGLSLHENATPIHVFHNSAGHLCGPSRSLGGILIGYIGTRCFVSRPVSVSVQDIGGVALLMGLVANAQDGESLYASLKALICALRVNRSLVIEMERSNGYQTLSMLLRRKKPSLSCSILHLVLNLTGTLDVYRKNKNSSIEIQHPLAFKDLLSDQMDLWMNIDLLKPLLEHLHEILVESSRSQRYQENKSRNLSVLREIGLLNRLLQLLWSSTLTPIEPKTKNVIENLIYFLLNQTPRQNDLLYFGQYITVLLPSNEEKEKSAEHIKLRNSLLQIVLKLITRNKPAINVAIQEELVRILGFDWFLLFLYGSFFDQDTLAIALVNLMILISNQSNYQRFKEASSNGGWIKDAEQNFSYRFGCQIIGFSVSSPSPTPPVSSPSFSFAGPKSSTNVSKATREEIFSIPGFQHLSWLMSYHINKPQIYLILFQGLLGKFIQLDPSIIRSIEEFSVLTLENLCVSLLGEGKRSCHISNVSLVCPDLSLTILSMIHLIIWTHEQNSDFAIVLIQFFICLYHNWKEFQAYCHSSRDFLNGLCNTIIREEEKGSQVYVLSDREACKHVMSFIRLIIVDSMICIPDSNGKSSPCVFEAALSTFSCCKSAQTELMNLLMNHLDSYTEVLIQQKRYEHSLQNQQNQIYQQTLLNINTFSSILSNKLWQECYEASPSEILDFQLNLIERLSKLLPASKKSSKSPSASKLSPLYRSLNRTVLYMLSRPIDNISDRMTMLETLQKIHTSRQAIVISPHNNEAAFYVCLTYCLLQLMNEEKVALSSKSRSVWHVNIDADKETPQQGEGVLLVASVSRKIWAEVYLHKKLCLEEALKVNLTFNPPSFGISSDVPDLTSLKENIHENLSKYWANYIESERIRQRRGRSLSHLSLDSPTEKDPTSLITEKLGKINKVVGSGGNFVSKIVGNTTGAVQGAISNAVGSSIKKEVFKTSLSCDHKDISRVSIPPWDLMSFSEVTTKTFNHIQLIEQLVDLYMKQKCQSDAHLLKFVYEDWIACENELLTRERAVWGPEYGSKHFDKWQLDMTEGPHRVRKKFIKNDMFYHNYPYREGVPCSEAGKKRAKYHPPMSYDAKEYFKRTSHNTGLLERDVQIEQDTNFIHLDEPSTSPMRTKGKSQERENSFEGIRTSSLLPSKEHSTDQEDSNVAEFGDITEENTEENSWTQVESQTVLRLLEDREKISHMFRCARIVGLDTFEGLLLFGKEHFYLLDGFTLLRTREIKDIDSIPPEMHDPIVPTTSSSRMEAVANRKTKKNCMKFAYEEIKEVHKRRYLLQPIAVEMFSMDGRNSLLVFPRKLRDKVYSRFMFVATQITDNAQDSLSGQKRNVNIESGAGILSSLMGDTSVTQRWIKGEISNFQYLMHLNTLAGRSYNDLMQYPVFPWIVADYTSNELDLNNPASFRDLSKPMGAQTPERLEHFRRRFNEWDEMNEDTPAYHYGTFYSSAMIVASYLVRIEPFTQHFLRLQGGHFDLADRMFHSVGDAYLSAAKNNVADVKELIPEFFCLPEFFINLNNYDLGIKQNGVRLGDVILPPWSKGDAREFIRLHRAALECDYVSAHLHEWIDLIFGYKQQGKAAIEAVNVYHHLFYEGNVDIYSIEDPLKKNATIGFINNFGQIPKQLFKKPHPAKKVAGISGAPLTPILPNVNFNTFLAGFSSSDKLIIHSVDSLKPSLHPIKELRGAVGQIIQQEKTLLAVEQNKVLIPPTYSRYVAWGYADHSLRIGTYESDRPIYIFESEFLPPNGEILCATVPNPRIVITAGTSSFMSVWRLKDKTKTLELMQHLYGHNEAITCLTSSATYGLIISGSRDRTCIVWDLNRLLFVRQLGGGDESSMIHPSPISAVAINDLTGDIVTCSANWLLFWSINGDFLATVNTLSVDSELSMPPAREAVFPVASTQILCAAFSLYNEWDPDNFILTGSTDGIVRVWSLNYSQVPIDEKDQSTWGSTSSLSDSSVHSCISIEHNNNNNTSHIGEFPSKDEIVRRMSLAAMIEEGTKDGEESSEDSIDNNRSPIGSRKSSSTYLGVEKQVVQITIDAGTPERRDSTTQLLIPSSKSVSDDLPSLKSGVSSRSNDAKEKKKPSPINISKIRPSKSDTSLCKSNLNEKQDTVLIPGNKWQRKLIFRAKLSIQQYVERKDETEPAAITSLAISKDHKVIFVGDARGRVYSWSISDGKIL